MKTKESPSRIPTHHLRFGSLDMWTTVSSNIGTMNIIGVRAPFLLLYCSSYIMLLIVTLLGEDAMRDRVLKVSNGQFFLVEAKRLLAPSRGDIGLSHHISEATAQAVALCEAAGYDLMSA